MMAKKATAIAMQLTHARRFRVLGGCREPSC